jgi:zinc metalloprotease ZmpB
MKSRLLFAGLIVFALLASLNSNALASKEGPGTSTGTGQVFFPNPVASLGNQSLTDQKDADYAALQSAYELVTLTNLDGSGYLNGDWANVRSATGDPAFSDTNTFIYKRNDDRFEQVMAYYWITEAQKYIQSLGFGSTLRPVNMESQDVRINQLGYDNSFSWDKKDYLRFGKGGVDDAEDAEVILHEYGHAILDSQSTPFGAFGASAEAGAIHEGFGDYWAVTVSAVVAPTADLPCVADWDSVSYTSRTPHCLRRVDTNLHYPEDLDGRVHHDGQIWSRALWDLRNALGHVRADTIILEAHFSFPNDASMPEAAEEIVNAAQSLYNPGVAHVVRAVFEARGILEP